MAPPLCSGEELMPVLPSVSSRQPWWGRTKIGDTQGSGGESGTGWRLNDGEETNALRDSRHRSSPYSNKLPRFGTSFYGPVRKVGKSGSSRTGPLPRGFARQQPKLSPITISSLAKTSGQFGRRIVQDQVQELSTTSRHGGHDDAKLYHQLPSASWRVGTLGDWQRSFLEGPRAPYLFPEDELSQVRIAKKSGKPPPHALPLPLNAVGMEEAEDLEVRDLASIDFSKPDGALRDRSGSSSSSSSTAHQQPPGPSPRDWMWKAGGGSPTAKVAQSLDASEQKPKVLPELVDKRFLPYAPASTIGSQARNDPIDNFPLESAARMAERHKGAAQTAANLAERYRDPVAKLKEEQNAWRRKHDALVRKKTREMGRENEDASLETGQIQGQGLDAPNTLASTTDSFHLGGKAGLDQEAPGSPRGVAKSPSRSTMKLPSDGTPGASARSSPRVSIDVTKQEVSDDASLDGQNIQARSTDPARRETHHYHTPAAKSLEGTDSLSSQSTTKARGHRAGFSAETTKPDKGEQDEYPNRVKKMQTATQIVEAHSAKRKSMAMAQKRRTICPGEFAQARAKASPHPEGGNEESPRDPAPKPAEQPERKESKPAKDRVESKGDSLAGLKGTKGLLKGRQAMIHDDSIDFNAVVQVAKKHNLSVDEVHDKMKDFVKFDKAGTGWLTMEEFDEVVRQICNVQQDAPTPKHLLTRHWSNVDTDNDGKVSFEEYVIWSMEVAYSEEVLVPDAAERTLRHLAREHGFAIYDVERTKRVFDEFDTDGSGNIEVEEFFNVIMKLMKVKNPADVSKKKLQRYWSEADRDGSGEISFEEFLLWYNNCAGGGDL